MNKRICVVLIVVLSLSVVLLGFSYSKESGTNNSIELSEVIKDDYRVVFSNTNRVKVDNEKEIDISVINKSNEVGSYYLELDDTGNNDSDIYYSIDGEEDKELKNGTIYLGNLNNYGTNGDHKTYSIRLRTTEEREFKLTVKRTDINLLSNEIIFKDEVYKDNINNLRFYGEKVNNYIIYNNQLCRIIVVIDGKIRIISEKKDMSVYDANNEYLIKDDYLASFDNGESWLNINDNYWINGDEEFSYVSSNNTLEVGNNGLYFYNRYVYELDEDTTIVDGDGSLKNPFGVAYGS